MSAIPTGYTPLPNGYYTKSDGSGPYVFDGAAMTLASTGSGGGGGGGGAVTVADGADATQGAIADAVVAAGAAGTLSAKLRRLTTDIGALLGLSALATVTDKSGTITVGGTAQTAIASNAARKRFEIQNQSVGDLYFSTLATAVQGSPSIRVAPGQFYEAPLGGAGTGAVSIIGATTGQVFAAREFT